MGGQLFQGVVMTLQFFLCKHGVNIVVASLAYPDHLLHFIATKQFFVLLVTMARSRDEMMPRQDNDISFTQRAFG